MHFRLLIKRLVCENLFVIIIQIHCVNDVVLNVILMHKAVLLMMH